jgi:hypothetical protein
MPNYELRIEDSALARLFYKKAAHIVEVLSSRKTPLLIALLPLLWDFVIWCFFWWWLIISILFFAFFSILFFR